MHALSVMMLTFSITLVQQSPASKPKRPLLNTTPPASIQLDPTLFHVKHGHVNNVEQLNLNDLYQKASQAYSEGKFVTSIVLYSRILRYFPKHKDRHAAIYNLALSYEDNREYQKALPFYQQITVEFKDQVQLVRNARFRQAECHNQLKEWRHAFRLYDKLLATDLPKQDRIDALAYAGRALFKLKRYQEAMPLLTLAVGTHTRTKDYLTNIKFSASMAQYYHARIIDLQFRQRGFHLPKERLKQDLEFKSSHLVKAMKLYFDTIRLRHADWALASIYRVGEMYEQMFHDMMAAPAPKKLNKEERKIYSELLRDRIKVLLEKALRVYKRSLLFAKQIGLSSNHWQTKSQKRFQDLQSFYNKHFPDPPSSKKSKPDPSSISPTSQNVHTKSHTASSPASRSTSSSAIPKKQPHSDPSRTKKL